MAETTESAPWVFSFRRSVIFRVRGVRPALFLPVVYKQTRTVVGALGQNMILCLVWRHVFLIESRAGWYYLVCVLAFRIGFYLVAFVCLMCGAALFVKLKAGLFLV